MRAVITSFPNSELRASGDHEAPVRTEEGDAYVCSEFDRRWIRAERPAIGRPRLPGVLLIDRRDGWPTSVQTNCEYFFVDFDRLAHEIMGGDIPEPCCVPAGRCHERTGLGVESQRVYAALVFQRLSNWLTAFGVPDLNGLIAAGRGQASSVRVEDYRIHAIRMRHLLPCGLARGRIPYLRSVTTRGP